MDEILFEKMLLELMPEKTRNHIHEVLAALKVNPHAQSQAAMAQMGFAYHSDNPVEQTNSINGFLAGVCFAYSWFKDPDVMNEAAKGFLAIRGKKRGDNVIDFLSKRIDRT